MSYGPECFTLFPNRRSKMSTTPQPSPALAALERAERTDPGNTFVASCRRFYEQRGDLSAKQIAALGRVRPTRGLDLAGPPSSWSASDHDDYGLGQSWDWAGGD